VYTSKFISANLLVNRLRKLWQPSD